MQGLEARIAPQFRVFVDGMDKDTGKVPNIAAMKEKIKAAVAGGTLDFEDAIEMTDVLKQMEAMGWDAETIEKLGGIKSKKTLNAEKKETEQQAAEAERLAEQKRAEELRRQEEDRLREEARIAKEEADAEEAVRHQREMEARKVVEQQEREKLAREEAQRKADKQMSDSLRAVSDIAKSFNIDPDEMVKLIEPLFQEMGGFEAINQMLGQETKERAEERAEEQATLQAQHERVVGRVEAEQAGKARRAADAAQQESEAKVLAQRAEQKQAAEDKKVKEQERVAKLRQQKEDRLREEARIAKEKAAQEREKQQESEAKVLARRAAEKKAAEDKKVADEKRVVKLKRLQQKAQDEKDFAALAEIEKALAKQTTGLGNQTKYPNKRLLKRLQDLQNRNLGIGEKLGPIEIKEMETIEKEIKNRKLTPLPLG